MQYTIHILLLYDSILRLVTYLHGYGALEANINTKYRDKWLMIRACNCVTMWLLLSAVSAAAVTGLSYISYPLLAATNRGHWSWCHQHSQYSSRRYVLVVIFCSGEFSPFPTFQLYPIIHTHTADCSGYGRGWWWAGLANRVRMVSDEEPSLPLVPDSQHQDPDSN